MLIALNGESIGSCSTGRHCLEGVSYRSTSWSVGNGTTGDTIMGGSVSTSKLASGRINDGFEIIPLST